MNNKGKFKYFALGMLVATLWFFIIGGIVLCIRGGLSLLRPDVEGGAVSEQNLEKMEYFQNLLQTYYYEDISDDKVPFN